MLQSKLPSVDKDNLTEEDHKILSEMYQLKDAFEITEEEIEIARGMFDTPEKFVILRKILGHVTNPERGVMGVDIQALVDADERDLKHYAIKTLIDTGINEGIRKGLADFYVKLKRKMKIEKLEELQAKNTEAFKEEKNIEKLKAEEADESRTIGERL